MEDIKKKLQVEIAALEYELRTELPKEILKARAHGDLSENAEYHAARDRQSFIKGRMDDIENKLARAEVIDPSKLQGDRVAFGARVKVANESGEEFNYRIVGADETDTAKGEISVTSPIARSLVGKEVGDEVKVRTPGGERVYEILEVTFK